MSARSEFAGEWLFVVDLDGIGGVKVGDAAVFDEDAGDAVASSGDDEGIIEADLIGAGSDFGVPIDVAIAEAEVPLADATGGVTALLEDGRKGGAAGSEESGRVAWEDGGVFTPPSVFARQERVAGGSAGSRGGVAVCEAEASAGEFIEVGSFEGGAAVTTEVAVADIIGEDEDDVGVLGGGGLDLGGGGKSAEEVAASQERIVQP